MGVVELKTAGTETGTLLSFEEWDGLVAQGRNILLVGRPGSGKSHHADATAQVAADSGRTVRLYRRYEEMRAIPDGVRLIKSLRREALVSSRQVPLLVVDDLDHDLGPEVGDILVRYGSRTQVVATMCYAPPRGMDSMTHWLNRNAVISPLLDRFHLVCTVDWRRRRIERVWP